MSLDPRDSRRRGRSKSPGRERSRSRVDERDAERERSRVRAPSPPSSKYERAPSPPSSRYERAASPPSSRYEDDLRERERERGVYDYEDMSRSTKPAIMDAEPRYDAYGARDPRYDARTVEPRDSRYDARADPRTAEPRYDARADPRTDPRSSYGSISQYRTASPPRPDYAVPGAFQDEEVKRYGGGREKDYYADKGYGKRDEYGRPVSPPKRSQYEEVDSYKYSEVENDGRRYEDDKYTKDKGGASFNISAGHSSISGGINIGHDKYASQYVKPPSPSDFAPGGRQYAEPKKWEYAQPEDIKYVPKQSNPVSSYDARPASPPYGANRSRSRHGSNAYRGDSARSSKSQIVTVEPGSRNRRDPSPNPGLAPRMHTLSVSTGHHGSAAVSLANAPGSPLLEAYHGTYQSISPMPSPLMIAATPHTDVNLFEPLSPSSSEDERRGKKSRRNARFHDPAEEAKILAQALKGERHGPDTDPLVEILPGLTHEQVLDLRVEYKRIVKTGSEKKGVNIAKHIKLRLKDEDPSLMKACYACALGKWESEAYWANFWYQGEKSRRELLIESLMGRTNREIREIKDGFADKKYSDSLTKCMKTELKEDKFKKAVLMVLEERKMEERPGYALDRDLIEDDVKDLHKAVRSEKGGESLMISIIVVRSDSHMREVLRLYEQTYQANFAREMLKKSGNLVGELLAHILNGIINKPVRDALLIQHALSLSKSDSIRTELLISRLVRYHWDRPHMEAIKREYRTRYGIDMQKAVAEGTRGEWGHFCEMLCVRRMGDEVREVKRVDQYRERR